MINNIPLPPFKGGIGNAWGLSLIGSDIRAFVIRNSQFVIALLLVILSPTKSHAWGFWAHKKINYYAIGTLPKEMLRFYKNNASYISNHSVDPDKKRHVDETEAPHHFIDLDHYGKYPYNEIPRKWKDATRKFTEVKLNEHGTVPWQISYIYAGLVKAFSTRDSAWILKCSAYLGHYMADACVPLHTTQNYDGQFSGQNGIHSLWEKYIPEQFGDNYRLKVHKAAYIKSTNALAWETILASNTKLDSVLRMEKLTSTAFPGNKKYNLARKKNNEHKEYAREFVKAYNDKLHGMVERRMKVAIYDIGSLWMSAWVDAGQPDLNKPFKKMVYKDDNAPEKGKWKGRSE